MAKTNSYQDRTNRGGTLTGIEGRGVHLGRAGVAERQRVNAHEGVVGVHWHEGRHSTARKMLLGNISVGNFGLGGCPYTQSLTPTKKDGETLIKNA